MNLATVTFMDTTKLRTFSAVRTASSLAAAIGIVLSLVFSSWLGADSLNWQVAIAVLALAVGIPHGSLDHLVTLPKSKPLLMALFITIYVAIAQGHWFFDREQILGIYGPLNIPLEEYLFFMVIPMAAIFTIEGVTTVKPHWRKDEFGE